MHILFNFRDNFIRDIKFLIVNFNYLNKFHKDGEQARGVFVRLPAVAVRVQGA